MSLHEGTCQSAAQNGHLDCLKYAYENGCSWNGYTCRRALEEGHLNCLKYAYENGCTWDKYSYQYEAERAAKRGYIDCLEYAKLNGCPFDPTKLTDSLGNSIHHKLVRIHIRTIPSWYPKSNNFDFNLQKIL